MDRPISTADVPPQFLKAAMLLGHIPWRSLSSDPRVSYGLYVPPTQYNPSLTSSSPPGEKLPLLVNIHSTRRRISAIDSDEDLVPFADSMPCAILAPLFPVGMDGPNDLDSYKLLRSKTLRSDLALLAILDDVAHRWPGVNAERVFLMGFSGGGQFAHRFLYLYPERIEAVSIGAPGRVTLLDERKWPGGVADVEALFGRKVEREGIKKVQIQLVVGDRDNVVHGGEGFWEWVRELKSKGKAEDAAKHNASAEDDGGLEEMRQGRLDTIREVQASWRNQGIEARLDIVEGMGHDAKPARGVVLAFLKRAMQDR